MDIGQKFNTLRPEQYYFYIDNHKKYSDFNTLGLYRSLLENENLTLEEKLAIREYAHKTFKKTFNFLQLKDPKTYLEVSTLGQGLTVADEAQLWREIIKNQQKILADKRIKHRNFGQYSKHNCGYETCIWNGLMIKQGSWLQESNMHFDSDKNKYQQKLKSDRRKVERKSKKQIIKAAIDET
jgi:hypothetical protein